MVAKDRDITPQAASREDAIAKYFPKKGSAITPTDISRAYSDSIKDKSKVDSNYAQKALKDSNYGISQAKDALTKATKLGNKAKIAEAKMLLARAQEAGGALKDVLKAMGYDSKTGTLPKGSGGTGGDTGGGIDSGGGTDDGDTPLGDGSNLDTKDPALEYQKAMDAKANRDAFEVMRITFESYGLGSLADTLTRMFKMGLSPNEALVKMKYDKTIDPETNKPYNAAYTLRFAGNQKRIAKGLNALSEAEYLASEDSYAETLRSYGLGNMLSVDRTVNEAKFSDYIGNDMSPVEFKDRVATASDRVINADKSIKDTFKTFYPNLTDNDLVAYFLNPTETIGKLKEKATAAEIGGAFTGQGLTTSRMSAEGFAAYGIDRAGALEGAMNIAGVLPEATKLKNVYSETGIEYNQQTAEEEFLKSSDAAKRKRNILASKERASFEGSAGNAPGAYSTSYLKKSSARGLI